ncbi:MAG: geranylgeranylglycerol-phosphate geranylgeranyltransferase [Bacteroidales bacterium]|nr:geranylgeranylglycerol-phosphate geranylgeranyltransferase [Bacteroidales bacterium]MDD4602845.1 geranylgeranylglycerol-phosphate geranylgeranyltransferase [Bacteroidales bacterium]
MKLTLAGLSKWIKPVGRFIRIPNLLIIILTQFLLRYCIVQPFLYSQNPDAISPLPDFVILVITTLLIAIGGYVINDYFDRQIDAINRPDKIVVDRLITARGAIKLHIILNCIAILFGFYLAFRIKALTFGLIFPFISGLLWIYSAKYKRVLFWGNFIVSALSAFVILIIWLYEFFWLRLNAPIFANNLPTLIWVSKVFLIYTFFAFLITLVREIIKDMEDFIGDKTYDCRTIPIVFGLNISKYIIAVIILATILVLAYGQLILFRLNWNMVFWYFMLTVQLPAIYLFVKLFLAKEKADYHFLSSLCKLIMVAGVLSLEIIFITN